MIFITCSFRISFRRKETSKKKKEKEKEAAANAADDGGGNSAGGNADPAASSATELDATGRLPAKFIRATTVKQNTLDPVWNERFRL